MFQLFKQYHNILACLWPVYYAAFVLFLIISHIALEGISKQDDLYSIICFGISTKYV